jgi:hypothetical protein
MALAMALACLANSNHSETSAVGAPSDHYHGPTAARWQSFVVTELAGRRQRRTTCHLPERSRAKSRSRAKYSASLSGLGPRPASRTHPRYALRIARRNRRKSRASRMCLNGQRNGCARVGNMSRNDIAPRLVPLHKDFDGLRPLGAQPQSQRVQGSLDGRLWVESRRSACGTGTR